MKIVQVVDLLRHQLVRLDAGDAEFEVGAMVCLEREGEQLAGQVTTRARNVPGGMMDKEYVLHGTLTDAQKKKIEKEMEGEAERVAAAKGCAEKAKLPMRFFASRCDLSGKIYSFFYTAEEKVDFRDLLKTLPKKVGARVHLQRVGARDRAKILGGFGTCGRPTCCSTFKIDLESVPLDAARDQNLLTRNNDKLFGSCGKLKCCLRYEVDLYRDMRRSLPHLKQAVIAEGKSGRVIGLDILNQKVKVAFDETDGIEVYPIAEVQKKHAAQRPDLRKPKPGAKKASE